METVKERKHPEAEAYDYDDDVLLANWMPQTAQVPARTRASAHRSGACPFANPQEIEAFLRDIYLHQE